MIRWIACLVALASVALGSGPVFAAPFKVLIATWRGCEEACTGFRNYLQGRPIDVEFLLRDADGDARRLPGFLAEARAQKVDLILTWGTTVHNRPSPRKRLRDSSLAHVLVSL